MVKVILFLTLIRNLFESTLENKVRLTRLIAVAMAKHASAAFLWIFSSLFCLQRDEEPLECSYSSPRSRV